jgi:hypothetical protein
MKFSANMPNNIENISGPQPVLDNNLTSSYLLPGDKRLLLVDDFLGKGQLLGHGE